MLYMNLNKKAGLLNIILDVEGVEICTINFIEIKKKAGTVIQIVIPEPKFKLNFEDYSEAEIKILFHDKEYIVFNFEIEHYESKGNQLVLYTNLDLPAYLYDQSVINVFHLIDKNEKLNWRSLSVTDKKGWLRTCLFLNGLPKKIQSGSLVIDCSEIHQQIDFYCLIGEVLVGSKGYFGQDLDGFADCLIESYASFVLDDERKIIFLNFENLEKVFSKDKAADFIIDKFKHNGFKIEIE